MMFINTRVSGSYGGLGVFRYVLPEEFLRYFYGLEVSAFKKEWSKYPAYIDYNLPTFCDDRKKYWLLCK